MPNQNKIIATRERIARDYCRCILWIDDEIKPHANEAAEREPYCSFFHPITVEFQKKGALCQLKDFPQIAGEGDPYAEDSGEITVCHSLAAMADVVILDWHLGSKDATHSSKILDGLIKMGGSRFIIILSQEPKLSAEFEAVYGESFKKSATGWYHNEKGQFVYLLLKSDLKQKGGGEALLDRIYSEMAVAYPDFLHWAAIEIAARIKTFAPEWLASLPNETDLAVLAEQIHSGEDVGTMLFENLLEDLKESIRASSLESLAPESFIASDWPKADQFKQALKKDLDSIPAAKSTLKTNILSMIPLAADDIQPLKRRGIFQKVLNEGAELESIKLFKASVDKLGDFSENISILPSKTSPIRTGSVFRSENAELSNKIWVCVSGSCDCIRADSLLFLIGLQHDESEGGLGSTFLRFQQKQYIFLPDAENLSSISPEKDTRKLIGFNQVGVLREVTVTRIIARYWGQTTRVGINQPHFIRDLRKER